MLLAAQCCRWCGQTYLDLPEARSVTGGHVLVEGLDGSNAGHLTVLLVHVVSAGARVVSDPDAEVLDLLWALLVDLRMLVGLLASDGAADVRIHSVCHVPG